MTLSFLLWALAPAALIAQPPAGIPLGTQDEAAGEYPRRAMSERPLFELFTSDDYPTRPLRRAVEGTVTFSVEVDSSGRVSGCRITATSGDSDLDRATCEIVRQRARFRPALDRSGRPMPDTISARVIWRIEHLPFDDYAPWNVVTAIVWSDPDPVCTETMSGVDTGRLSATECLDQFGDAVLAVRDARGGIELRIVDTFTPEGSAAFIPDSSGFGDRIWLEEVELTINVHGKVDSCDVIRAESFPLLPSPASRCEIYLHHGAAFEPLPVGESHLRRGRAVTAVYARISPE